MNEKLPVFTERILVCLDCGREFTFGTGEQQFFWSKGLAEPKRCKECRQLRKATIVNDRTDKKHG